MYRCRHRTECVCACLCVCVLIVPDGTGELDGVKAAGALPKLL